MFCYIPIQEYEQSGILREEILLAMACSSFLSTKWTMQLGYTAMLVVVQKNLLPLLSVQVRGGQTNEH